MGEIRFQMLIYPVLDARMGTDSMRKYTDSPIWNARLTERMWRLYLKDADHGMQNYASPACEQELHDLPPAYIEAEEFDCLHDEGISYANRLKACGVPVHLEDVKGTFHGFDVFHNTEISRKMIHTRGMALHRAFWKGKAGSEDKEGREEWVIPLFQQGQAPADAGSLLISEGPPVFILPDGRLSASSPQVRIRIV